MIHCWHPDKHQNGDRTASVGIKKKTNRVKCFGCGPPIMSVVDLVCDVLGVEVAAAAAWIDGHFEVPQIAKRRHLEPNKPLRLYAVGREDPIELLVKSGIWSGLSPQAQRVAPVLLSFAEEEGRDCLRVQISNRAIMRYSGVKSFTSVSKGISQLVEIEWLIRVPGALRSASGLPAVSSYRLTPYSNGLMELANILAAQNRNEIAAEREMRKQQRRARRQALEAATRCVAMKATDLATACGFTEYKPLYTERSVEENGATQNEAPNGTAAGERAFFGRFIGRTLHLCIQAPIREVAL
jgi:hypothetical protein